jgi:hypothetical protein
VRSLWARYAFDLIPCFRTNLSMISDYALSPSLTRDRSGYPDGQKRDHVPKGEQLRPIVVIIHKQHQLPQFIVVGGRIRIALYGCRPWKGTKEVCRVSKLVRRIGPQIATLQLTMD